MTRHVEMPRLGVNDDEVTLITWLVMDGDWVEPGQKIAEIETSKEAGQVEAKEAGFITLLAKEGEDIGVGNPIASIGEGEKPKVGKAAEKPELRMTEKAKKIVEEYHVDISRLPKDRLIRESDVMPFVKKAYSLAGTKNNEIILYGGGSVAKIAIDILKVTHAYHVYGIVDINYPELKEVMGVPVIGNDEQLQDFFDAGYGKIFNGIGIRGSQHWRKPPYEKLKRYGFEFPNIIHERAILEPSTCLGEGNLICAGAIIGAQVQIGSNCIINSGCIISHDCIISDNCHIASGAVLAGTVIVGENTLIGQNVTVYIGVQIGNNVVIENGCNIFKNVPDNSIVRYKG